MRLGNSRIVECPFCGAEKELLSLLSGIGIGSTSWSDGKTVSPMLPRVSPVQKCPRCGKYYLHYKQEGRMGNTTSGELGELSYSQWKEVYEQFKEDSTIDDRDRCGILINMIHAYNNTYYRLIYRSGTYIYEPPFEPNPPKEEFEFFVNIIEKYIALADWERPNDILFKAELYREAGMFEQCAETLKTVDYKQLDEDIRGIYREIEKRMEDKVKKVFRIGEVYVTQAEKLEAEKRRAIWEQREKVFNEQAADPRWKVCKHGHCFKNTERECRWCGEEEFVERIDEHTPIFTKQLFVGKRNGKWVLTTDQNIEGQTERIRSITIDYNGKYHFYYLLDGKNPHPFYFNSIRLDDNTSIEGKRIAKACDLILSGKTQEVSLLPV